MSDHAGSARKAGHDARRNGAHFRSQLLCLMLCLAPGVPHAHDWFTDYTTGREEFESCCGDRDCHTAASLGNPRIVRRNDGGYNVKVGSHWIRYDHPAVHVSHDSQVWICFLEAGGGVPDPLCLFLPPGMS